jgi:hypothetical protein
MTGKNWRNGMHGGDYSHIDYASQYPSEPIAGSKNKGKKVFHNVGIGAANIAVYPPHSIPQQWPGLGDPAMSQTNTESWETRSIEQLLNDYGYQESGITILKVDVEGAEWDAFEAFLSSTSMQQLIRTGGISQLLVEWHWDPYSNLRSKRQKALLDHITELGFVLHTVQRHSGSDCCLDASYVWRQDQTHFENSHY